ncbi:MAG: glycosyltransferase family 2 protein [Mucilaginibacter sp.]|nr:glycosyltransferase family 2 protein [Mucilaginibacter sp.]
MVSPELKQHLSNVREEDYAGIDAIYFNRKNFFKGKWIKHGGYYPFYLLKMMRYGTGYSDNLQTTILINQSLYPQGQPADHYWIVP